MAWLPGLVPDGGYLTWSYADETLRRQVAVSFTPWSGPEPEEQVEALLERALCP